MSSFVSLGAGANGLLDEKADDYESDPAGNSGDRMILRSHVGYRAYGDRRERD